MSKVVVLDVQRAAFANPMQLKGRVNDRESERELEAAKGAGWLDAALLAYGRTFEHPSKIRIVRWLVRTLSAGQVQVKYARGATITIDPSDYVGWAIFRTGHYEPASLSLALRIMAGDPGLFVDVGSNFGWYTCAIAAIAGSSVVTIEPDGKSCALLRENIASNNLQNVTIFNGAVGPDFDLARMARRSPTNSGTNAILSADEDRSAGAWVATVPLETLLKRLVCAPGRPVLIKIDVEGFERQVLSGLNFDGPFRPKNILMEFDRNLSAATWGSFANLRAFFESKGYELFDVFGHPARDDGPLPEENVWARERS